jgi:pyridoxal phosphate enzyme (YggS family)
MSDDMRRTEIAHNLLEVQNRIAAATVLAGREVPPQLVVVTKTFPATDIAILAELGVRDIAENRDQEARRKFEECSGLDLRWHMIGQVQRKKAASVFSWADLIETVDRPELADSLDRAASTLGRTVDVLLQVSLDEPFREDRGGCRPTDLEALANHAMSLDALKVRGVMAVAPFPGDPDQAFERLAEIVQGLRDSFDGLEVVSAGMSGDLEAAIAHGATQVRIGGSILGARPPVQ